MSFEELEKKLPGVQQNISLAEHTTFKIGGPAEYFFVAHSLEELVHAIEVGKELQLSVFTMGGGSNLLVSDEGIKGLVVKMESASEFSIHENMLTANAGVQMKTLVDASVAAGLKGLEWAGGLPGSFGGAIRGNAGAFGGEIKDTILEVKALDSNYQLQTFDNAACQFSYRNSVFKERGWIIVSASVGLALSDPAELRAIADSRIAYRNEKHPLEYPSAGSVFKNVDVKKILPHFMAEFLDKIKHDPFPIVPAAWFIIFAGLKGVQVGQAQISIKHSNYIVNLGGATAKDVLGLMKLAQEKVKEKYHIDLEPEIQYLK